MKKIFNIAAIAALAFLGLSCVKGDKFNYGKEVFYMVGTDQIPLDKIVVEDNPPAVYSVNVASTGKLSSDATIELNVGDEAALAKYNEEHGTSYQIVPSDMYTVDKPSVVIKAGYAASESCTITITNYSFIKNGVAYMIPVSIKSVSGSSNEVLETSRTSYLRLARTISFYALDVADSNMSSNIRFADDKGVELSQYTYEIKLYPYNLKKAGEEQLCRVCNWTGPTGRQCMLRFNENGRPWKSLQIVTPSGGDYTTTTIFEPKQWYMLSIVYDGNSFQLYIDGEPDRTTLGGDQSTKFQQFELGMSWTSYPSKQLFSGRLSEIRVWNYPRTKTQIKGGLCGTDPESEGLVAYWKMNEGSGHIFHDSTGHGYDMDWSKSEREINDGTYSPTPGAGTTVESHWVKDDINKCSE